MIKKEGDLLIQKLKFEQLRQWADERDRQWQRFLVAGGVPYRHPPEFWGQWVEGTIDRMVTDPVDTQVMGVILSVNVGN